MRPVIEAAFKSTVLVTLAASMAPALTGVLELAGCGL
jgi:hypothetical protein